MQIKDSTILVAGGGSGLGAATVRMLVANGGHVIIADLNAEAINKLASELGAATRFIETNVCDETQVQAAVDLAKSAFGGLHGAVNCAGVAPGERVVGKRSAFAGQLSPHCGNQLDR